MKEDAPSHETTSRRQFTKAIVTAAVAAPVAATVSCRKEPPSPPTESTPDPKCPVKVGEIGDGITESTWSFPIHEEDHIPPMGVFGGSSVVLDSKNVLTLKSGSGSGPFIYEDSTSEEDDLYGEIYGATIIIEMAAKPFKKIKNYSGFPRGTELRLYYQSLKDSPGTNENDYEPIPSSGYPVDAYDVKINGGEVGNPLKIEVKKKGLDSDKSHKEHRPYRYKHAKGGGIPKHFRIGQWRFMLGARVLAESKGDDNYLIYLEFEHAQ